MEIYKTKSRRITGTNFNECRRKADRIYRLYQQRTKRRPYIRSAYFSNQKIFLDLFWHHLFEMKNRRDRLRRVVYFECAIELVQKSRIIPDSKENPNNRSEILHRFAGVTPNGESFYVQIKENVVKHQKFLISIFPKLK